MNMKIYTDKTNRNKKFEKLVVMTQPEMKKYVASCLKQRNKKKVTVDDGFVFYHGTFPVLLCAHMDTVHKELPKALVYANGTVSSPQGIGGDDRCGIYMIFKILKDYDCSVVFLEDEEIGCIGANKFADSETCAALALENELKYIIEFDRKGANHAVTYDCANDEFDKFITEEFFKKETGTCSDISYIAPELGVAAVNLSCGYYNEHHLEHWVNLQEMETVIVEAKKILERTKKLEKPFDYIQGKKSYGGYYYGGYSDWYDNYYESYMITYKKNGNKISVFQEATSEASAYYNFCKKNPKVCYEDVVSVVRHF